MSIFNLPSSYMEYIVKSAILSFIDNKISEHQRDYEFCKTIPKFSSRIGSTLSVLYCFPVATGHQSLVHTKIYLSLKNRIYLSYFSKVFEKNIKNLHIA